MNFATLLENSLSPDKSLREGATLTLENAARQNFSGYMEMLVLEFAKEPNPIQVRISAGLAMKNALTANDAAVRKEFQDRWCSLDVATKNNIKTTTLGVLGSPETKVGLTAALIVAAIAHIDLPRNEWPELIPSLTSFSMASQDAQDLRRASFQAIGFICEEVIPASKTHQLLVTSSSSILTVVASGIRGDERNNQIRLAAVTALCNSLTFIKQNFQNVAERNYIMQVVCEATQCEDPEVQRSAFECLVKIMSLYYEFMQAYMEQALYALTVEAIRSKHEGVALQAIEFWSTVCEEEIELATQLVDGAVNFYFANSGVRHVIPVLLSKLPKEGNHSGSGDWSISMAAFNCICSMAKCIGDDIMPYALPFVQKFIHHPDWSNREAAITCFGAIMIGPTNDTLSLVVSQALPVIMDAMKDKHSLVKESAAWTLGRIADVMGSFFVEQDQLQNLISLLLTGMSEEAPIAANCAWVILNFSEYVGENEEDASYLIPYFEAICNSLLQCSERGDGQQVNLRTCCYEALSNLIEYAPFDVLEDVEKISHVIFLRLEKSILIGIEQQEDLQANLCRCLQACIRKINFCTSSFTDSMIPLLFRLISSPRSEGIREDLLMAVMDTIGEDFGRYLESFMPLLSSALQNHEQQFVCAVAIGIVGQLCNTLGNSVEPYCHTFFTIFFHNLQQSALSQKIKPLILSSFGDIAQAIGSNFEQFFDPCMRILYQASQVRVAPDSYSNFKVIDYVNSLREGILEGYTGIVQGFGSVEKLFPYFETMFDLVFHVSRDTDRWESVTRLAVGLLGDITNVAGEKYSPLLLKPSTMEWIVPFLEECQASVHQATYETANWTSSILSQFVHVWQKEQD
eukprot:Lithocolla_globosa_v1_NODE_202_length_5196_cov_7.727290.p1 type:complete len:857 gc:universal NODE_202_length_5196_cov_7.727290:2583-5153(+)